MLLNVLLALLIVVGVSLTGLVLLQRSEGGALGMGGGGGGQLVSARGAANFLTRSTWWFGGVFFVLSLLITILLGNQSGSGSITDKLKIEALDPSKIAADNKAQFDDAVARQKALEAQKSGALPGGFTAPAPSVGVTPFSTAPTAPTTAPFAAPAPKIPAAAPKSASPKAATPAAPAPAEALPIIPTPNP